MHKDFQQKKRVELESLSGFISKTKEVPTPLMDRFYKALKQKM
jgi:ketopantoate reductase